MRLEDLIKIVSGAVYDKIIGKRQVLRRSKKNGICRRAFCIKVW
jgi:hypothetical protein